jgi:hypothetical protein
MRWAARLSKSFVISRGGSCIEVWETDLEDFMKDRERLWQ